MLCGVSVQVYPTATGKRGSVRTEGGHRLHADHSAADLTISHSGTAAHLNHDVMATRAIDFRVKEESLNGEAYWGHTLVIIPLLLGETWD